MYFVNLSLPSSYKFIPQNIYPSKPRVNNYCNRIKAELPHFQINETQVLIRLNERQVKQYTQTNSECRKVVMIRFCVNLHNERRLFN